MKKPKPLTERLTATMLKQLHERKITNMQAAEKLGVSETYLSRTVASLQGKKPGVSAPQRAAAAKLYKTRMQVRNTLAKKVNSGKLHVADAAAQAGCSERTMFRHMALYRA